MIGLSALDRPEVRELATKGSPRLLSMVGRAFGLGEAEQRALVNGRFPTWFWIGSGVALGLVAGLYVERQWPGKIFKTKGK
jgi:hypothetical protein